MTLFLWDGDHDCIKQFLSWIYVEFELPEHLLNIGTTWASNVKLWILHAPGMLGTFSPPARVSGPDMHHGTCLMHVPWCILGSLTSGFIWSRWRGKLSQHARRMCHSQFFVSICVAVFRSCTPDQYTPFYLDLNVFMATGLVYPQERKIRHCLTHLEILMHQL